jgi:hypothetical protein
MELKGTNMKNRISLLLGATLATTLVLWPATDVYSGSKKHREVKYRLKAKPFSFSTGYSGPLTGDYMLIEGRQYQASDAAVYLIGKGLVEEWMMVNDRFIYVAGERKGGRAVVHTVIVRPPGEDMEERGDRSKYTGTVPKKAPR